MSVESRPRTTERPRVRTLGDIDFLMALARRLGIAIIESAPPSWVCERKDWEENAYCWWDGRILYVDLKQYRDNIHHEIAHFIVSPRDRRYSKNYGIEELSESQQANEESKVSAVEKALRLCSELHAERLVELAQSPPPMRMKRY